LAKELHVYINDLTSIHGQGRTHLMSKEVVQSLLQLTDLVLDEKQKSIQ